ncbi:hypothetical protein C0Q70_17872 [Pomacea canaliculata]|uniref:Uncharacterized protein n=1 Tax=Pomacea canaliculata TaxID=400727 RepID=A0A2T7NLM4_POMCA|nr:hypothetical protein C0Q70_17872 [Pomacea canaliculata]
MSPGECMSMLAACLASQVRMGIIQNNHRVSFVTALLPDCYAYLLSEKVGGGPSIPSVKHVMWSGHQRGAGCLGWLHVPSTADSKELKGLVGS